MAADVQPIFDAEGDVCDDAVFLEALAALIERGLVFRDANGGIGLTEMGEAAAEGRCDFLPIEVKHGR